MIDPGMFRSNRVEFMAIPLMVVLLGALFVVFAVAEIGVWAWILTGVVILAAILMLVWRVAERHRHPPAADAPRPAEQPRPAGAHRILVVADESCAPGAIRETVAARSAGRPSVAFVVAPASGSRLDRLTGDEAGYEEAARHLDETLAELAVVRDLDVKRGKVGRTTRSRPRTRPCASFRRTRSSSPSTPAPRIFWRRRRSSAPEAGMAFRSRGSSPRRQGPREHHDVLRDVHDTEGVIRWIKLPGTAPPDA